MCRAADEVDRALAQLAIAIVDGVDELERDVEPFFPEETQLHRRSGGEVGGRDQVRDGELYGDRSGVTACSRRNRPASSSLCADTLISCFGTEGIASAGGGWAPLVLESRRAHTCRR